jgi:hypothetical protein
MPDDVSNNIPFSLGLEVLPATAFQLIKGSNFNSSYGSSSGGNTYFGYDNFPDNYGGSANAVPVFNSDFLLDGYYPRIAVGLDKPKIEDGVYLTDKDLKQVYIEMTVFQSFPVQMEDGTYTYVPDGVSANTNDGTKIGELSLNFAQGRCGFCDKFDATILKDQINKGVQNFKVGASIGHDNGMAYLRKFYPGVKWKSDDFAKLKKAGFFLAEMLIPISTSTAIPVRCALVDNGPFNKWAIDVMGAFCLLDEFKNLFRIRATRVTDNTRHTIGDTIKFPFADKKYDYINGEILGYSPSAILDWIDPRKGYKVLTNSPFRGDYSGECINGPKHPRTKNSMIRVKFYIDPSNREAAEQTVGKILPDDLFKPNYTEESLDVSLFPGPEEEYTDSGDKAQKDSYNISDSNSDSGDKDRKDSYDTSDSNSDSDDKD